MGPRPARRHEVALRACVGLVPECEFGPYGSRERRQAEDGMLCAMGKWTQAEGGVRPTGVIGGGWTISCQWAGGRGTRLAAMDIYPVGGPSTAAMQQLRHWLADGGIRLPLASDPSVMVVVPCMACPGELPLGQVQVTFRGLPSAFMLKDTVHTILRAVGYTGETPDAPKLRPTEVFLGWHDAVPNLADGSLCAFVDQPAHDPELRRLPSTICLGHNQAVIEVTVSSRRAVFVSCPPATAAPAAAQPPPPPTTQPATQPPPAPPTAPRGQPWAAAAAVAPGPAAAARAVAAAAAAAAAAAPAAVAATAEAPAPAGMEVEQPDVVANGLGGGAAASQTAAGLTVAPGPSAASGGGDALDLACVGRPEMAGQLTAWAVNAFSHAVEPVGVRRLLAAAVAESAVVQGQLQRLAMEPGELNLEELPPEPLQLQLFKAFAAANISAASYETEDGVRRSARLRPAPPLQGQPPEARGRSLVRGSADGRRGSRSALPSSPRGRRARTASRDGGGAGRDGRSRSRSRGGTSE